MTTGEGDTPGASAGVPGVRRGKTGCMTTDATTPRPLALVTGASSGIGYALTVQADLRDPDGVERLHASVRAAGRPLDAAALNAGIGRGGRFVDVPLADSLGIVDLNVRSTVHLAGLLLADMVAADAGRILFTSSIVSGQPGPYQAVYNASKSFVQSFGEAVADELKDTGVTVTVLMPGPTDTDFFRRSQQEDTAVGRGGKGDPAKVARQGFEALMQGDERVVAGGLKTKATAAADTVLPDKAKAAAHRKLAKPR